MSAGEQHDEVDAIGREITTLLGRTRDAAAKVNRHYDDTRREAQRAQEAAERREDRAARIAERAERALTQKQRAAERDLRTQLAAELETARLARVEQHELITQWAAAEADRDADPERADALTARVVAETGLAVETLRELVTAPDPPTQTSAPPEAGEASVAELIHAAHPRIAAPARPPDAPAATPGPDLDADLGVEASAGLHT